MAIVEEFLGGDSPEAELARAVDNLEFLLQARDYRDAGHRGVEPMIRRAKNGSAWAHPVTRPWVERILKE